MTTMSFDVVIEQPVIGVSVEEVPVGAVVIGSRGPKGDPGPGVDVWTETITGDGVQTVFTLSHLSISPLSVQVFRNGLAEVTGIGFFVSNDGNATVLTFSSAPLEDDEVQVLYHV